MADEDGLDALIASSRFVRAWALLDQPDEINRHAGLEAIRRMLTGRGSTMADLLVRLGRPGPAAPTTPPPSSEPPTPPPRPARRPFGTDAPFPRAGGEEDRAMRAADMMRGLFVPTAGRRLLQGRAVPGVVTGRVVELASSPSGDVAAFAMIGPECAYGPIAALDGTSIELLRSGVEAGARMTVHLSPASPGLPHPVATRVGVALA